MNRVRAFQRRLLWSLLCALSVALLAPGNTHAESVDSSLDTARQRLDAVQRTLVNPPTDIDLDALRADATAIGAEADATALRVQPPLANAQA